MNTIHCQHCSNKCISIIATLFLLASQSLSSSPLSVHGFTAVTTATSSRQRFLLQQQQEQVVTNHGKKRNVHNTGLFFTALSAVNGVSESNDKEEAEAPVKEVEAIPTKSSVIDPTAKHLKEELLQLASVTKRGFSASKEERNKARSIIYDLAKYNPTKEPAASYYASSSFTSGPSLSGKWTLIYTDAPDITSLDPSLTSSSSNLPITLPTPPPTAKLGRIGQECNPPLIKNVIEWKKPDWIPDSLPFSGKTSTTILQKVCCEASSNPSNPNIVDLKLVGFDLINGDNDNNNDDDDTKNSKDNNKDMEVDENGRNINSSSSFVRDVLDNGIVPSLLKQNPLEVRGIVSLPFGRFEILYLDEELRIIKTGQNYLAVNVRQRGDSEWF